VDAALGFLALGLIVAGSFVLNPGDRISSHLPMDQIWFEWLLGHGAHSLEHLQNPLFTTRQNFPDGVNMMANTSVLGVTLPLAPLTLLLGVRVTYVIWMVGALAGTAFAAYWVLQRHVVSSRAAAWLGGAFAGFAPGIVHHANGQPNFISNFVLPFIVVAVFRLGIGGRWLRDGIVLGLLVAYQIFINEEMLLVTAAALIFAVWMWAVLNPARVLVRAPAFLLGAAVTALVAGALCAYPLWFQFHGPQSYEALPLYHSWGEDYASYVTLPRDTIFGDPQVEETMGWPEQNSWFGWPLTIVVLATVAALIWRNGTIRVAALTGAFFSVAALGPVIRWRGEYGGGLGPWHWIPDDLPILGLVVPSRFTFAVVGVFAVVIAVGFDAASRVRKGGILGLAFVVALFPLMPKALPVNEYQPPPDFITGGAWKSYVGEGRTLIPLPLADSGYGQDTLSWNAWTRGAYPMPEGYFLGPGEDGHGKAGSMVRSRLDELVDTAIRDNKAPEVTAEDRTRVMGEIVRFRGDVLVTRNVDGTAGVYALMQQLIGPGELVQDVWIWDV
jgi:hypothetical protein